MKIAVAGIGHETNTFSTLRTKYEDFWIRRGEECVAAEGWGEIKAMASLAPCLVAGATPNGLVAKDAYLKLKVELLRRLSEQLPIDGLFLVLHGAMHVEEIGDGETDLLRDIRNLVGLDLPIAATLDLHGNLSPEFVSSVNILSALRTAPHIDYPETRKRTFLHLVKAIREGKRPVTSMVKLPLLLPGENAVTAIEPSKSLYAQIVEIEKEDRIWDASLMISCAWTDSPYTSVSTLVVGEDRSGCEALAFNFAERVWEKRNEFGPEVETIPAEEAIRRAASLADGPFFISESGDNVTAGAAGDVTTFLKMLIDSGLDDVLYAGIADREAVDLCASLEVGAHVVLKVGRKLDRQNSDQLAIAGKLLHRSQETATIRIGGLLLVLTSGRKPFHTLGSFECSGVDPLKKRVVVVKQGYLAPELRERCSGTVMALTPGFTDLRLKDLLYQSVVRPIYPLDDAVFPR